MSLPVSGDGFALEAAMRFKRVQEEVGRDKGGRAAAGFVVYPAERSHLGVAMLGIFLFI